MSSSVGPHAHDVAFLEPDERNDEFPPRVIEISDDLPLPPGFIRTNPEGHAVQPRHVEIPSDNWIPSMDTSNSVRLPSPHELQCINDDGDRRGRGRDRLDSPRLGARGRSMSYSQPYSRAVPRFLRAPSPIFLRTPPPSSKRVNGHRVPFRSRSHSRSRTRSKSRSSSAAGLDHNINTRGFTPIGEGVSHEGQDLIQRLFREAPADTGIRGPPLPALLTLIASRKPNHISRVLRT